MYRMAKVLVAATSLPYICNHHGCRTVSAYHEYTNVIRAQNIRLPHGPGQVKLLVGQADLSKVFFCILQKQIEKVQNLRSWAGKKLWIRRVVFIHNDHIHGNLTDEKSNLTTFKTSTNLPWSAVYTHESVLNIHTPKCLCTRITSCTNPSIFICPTQNNPNHKSGAWKLMKLTHWSPVKQLGIKNIGYHRIR